MPSSKKLRRGSLGDTDDDSGDDANDTTDAPEEEKIEFSQPGSIKRLKFTNFMQYTEVEFQCGPNLNVIIGNFSILISCFIIVIDNICRT